MIKRNQTNLMRLNAAADFLLVVFCYIFSAWFRLRVLHGWYENRGLSVPMIAASLCYAAGLILFLALSGFYRTDRIRRLSWKLGILFVSITTSILIVTAIIFAFKIQNISRGIIFLFYLFTLVCLGTKQIIIRLVFNQMRKSGYSVIHEMLIGTGRLARQYQEDVRNEPELFIRIVAVMRPEEDPEERLSHTDIDEVVIALEPDEYVHIPRLIAACEKNGVKYLIIPFYSDKMPAHPIIETVGRTKLVDLCANRLEELSWGLLKRVFDVAVSAIGLILLSPLLLIIAAGIKLSSPGPVFFRQTRVGYNRHTFQMLKFRSMRVNDESDTQWTTASDDRRTRFGAFLRKTSLDELPQLWNVLKGDMSLVGPRPELPHFVEQFREKIPLYMVKHQVKPGITGWAQVNGYRGDTSIEKRIEYDLWYIDNWSPWLDLKILFMTFPGSMLNDEQLQKTPDLDVKVVVAAHKAYWMPTDPMYLPVQAGAEGKEDLGFTPDNTGDNISARNSSFCELTALYWAWKNLDAEYLGLVHYRRHFTVFHLTRNRKNILTRDQACRLLDSVEVLLPRKRNYWIETNYSQYVHAHHAADLEKTREVLADICPEYLESYDQVMKKTKGHRFNMFIMKREQADAYCEWLFGVLFELERRLDVSGYSEYDSRVFGFVAERLLDVWLRKNQISFREVPYISLEKQHWFRKGIAFLKRKLRGGKKP